MNNYVVVYVMMAVLSLGLCVPAAFTGWFAAARWKEGASLEVKHRIEKKAYLVISFLSLVFVIRLFMIPLWFLTIQSLVSFIPGAMCMTGVHLLDIPISVFATILKFFIPLSYIYWLILNSVDRRIESQPFLKKKLIIVAFLAALMAAESFVDMHFLHSVRPRIVSCCTSVFDMPKIAALKMLRQSGMVWMVSLSLSLAVSIISYIMRHKWGKAAKVASAISSLAALISMIFILQTMVSPVMLETPYHQCVFCLWQGLTDIAIASGAVILGLWLTFVCAAMPDLNSYPRSYKFVEILARHATLLYAAGAAWIAVRFALKYLFSISAGA